MAEDVKLARIMQLRALGWSQKEIAKEVGSSEASVSYHLRRMRERSMEEGPNVFWEVMATSAVRWLNRKLDLLEKLG